ncbi:putative LRR receptor-like serine/threonine-protein kinase [Glycine soja]
MDNMERETRRIVILNVWAWLALVSLFTIHTNSALENNNPGFISIDCGSEAAYSHTETGIWFETDNDYVGTGSNHMVSSNVNLNYRDYGRQLNTLRCFPKGERNCYTLKPQHGKNNSSKYLIRAFFSYGNYDGKNEAPSFDMYIGVNLVDKVNLTDYADTYWFTEIIQTVSSESIDVYKDDVYDRIWRCDLDDTNGWYPLVMESLNLDSGRRSSDIYKLPSQVLRTAVQSPNQLPIGKKRIINVTLNYQTILTQPLVLEYLKPVTIAPQKTSSGSVLFNVSATSESDAPPILNAFEVYKLITQLDLPTQARDVGAIVDIKSAYQISRLNWQGDPCVPKQYAWDGLICSSYNTVPRITSLNLSSSNLKGQINMSFSYLTELEILDLSQNELEGSLPEFLAQLPNNVTGNKLSGPIPKALKEKADLQLSVEGNPYLCTSSTCRKRKKVVIPLVVTFVGAFIILSIVSLSFLRRRRLQGVMGTKKLSCFNKIEYVNSNKQEFTYAEVLSITNNFEKVAGKGAYGTVYYGCKGETQVAVKMLSPSTQGFQQFQTEAKILTRVHHTCLTPLIGYCNEATALIYKYMAYGDLANHLSDKNQILLSWKQRLQIALDSATGLEYLHKYCKPPIVHRDVKTSNILLDEDFHAKVSDFGLSRIFSNECDSHVLTKIAGTPGYMDPEYQITNKLTEKSDVYSFGIVLLEIITGHPAILKTHENTHIVQWVNSMLADEGEIDSIMDPRLQGIYDSETASKVVHVAMACLAPSSIKRPTMDQVVKELKQCFPMENIDDSICIFTEFSVASISGESSLAR